MDLSSPPAQVFDHRFFWTTGLVLVLGTLMAGGITVSLAINLDESASRQIIAGNLGAETVTLRETLEFVRPATDFTLE